MTVWIRDASNFDGTVDFAGLAGFTHKATEGISVVHDRYGPRLNAARDAGVPVLGAYHVLRSPSAANGSYADQLRFWIGFLDAHTSWWRGWPHWILQIDAERWAYDNVTPAEVLAFAALLAGSGLPGWKVTYASRGQYGDSLRGIATPLWNADYRGSSGGSYPGDGWVSSVGSAAGWAPYSGQAPALLQYTSTPYDENAFRGTLAELLALTEGDAMTPEEHEWLRQVWSVLGSAYAQSSAAGESPVRDIGGQVWDIGQAQADLKAQIVKLGAHSGVTLTDAQVSALGQQLGAALGGKLDQVLARLEAAGKALEA